MESTSYAKIPADVKSTIGSELFDADASTFDSGTHSWVVYGSNTIANDSGALKITYVDDARGAYLWFKDASDLSSDLTVGKTYKFTFDAKVSSGASVDVTVSTLAGSPQVITETSFTTKSIYFTAENTNSTYVDTRNMGSGEIIYLDNFSLKEVQGNTGTMTNQAADDLVYSSVLPDQSFLTGVNSAYNFIDLGGTDEYISLPESFRTDIATQTGTVNLWVKPTSDNDAEQMLFTYNNSSTRTDLLFRYGWGDNRINLGIAQSGSQKWFAYSATNSVSSHLNNWNMITLVHNGTEPKLYANGIELSITFATSTDKTFWFGDMVENRNKDSLRARGQLEQGVGKEHPD